MFRTGDILVNRGSNSIYKVAAVNLRSFNLKRLGDGFLCTVTNPRIGILYRKATEVENQALSERDVKFNESRPIRVNDLVSESDNISDIESDIDDVVDTLHTEIWNDIGVVYKPDLNVYNLDRVILSEEAMRSIRVGIKKIQCSDFLYHTMDLKSIDPNSRKTVLNFYGAPGTGKTMTAKAIAAELGSPILQVDYAKIISDKLGHTAKNIVKCFHLAKEHNAVLFFDEADSLCSKRLDFSNHSVATSINQNRNVFMQNIDTYNGIVILATNVFENFDEAFLRRIGQHINFKLPDEKMRYRIIQNHIPLATRAFFPSDVEIDSLAFHECTLGLSGGDLLNGIKEAITHAVVDTVESGESPENTILSLDYFFQEFSKIREAKLNYLYNADKN